MEPTSSSATVVAPRALDETDAVRVVRAVAMLFCGELEAGHKDVSGPVDAQADYRRLAHGRVSWRCVNREAVQRVHLQRLCEVGVFLMYDTSDANRLIAGLLRRDASLAEAMRVMNRSFSYEIGAFSAAFTTDLIFGCAEPAMTMMGVAFMFALLCGIGASVVSATLISVGINSESSLLLAAGVATALLMLLAAMFVFDFKSYTLWATHQREFHYALMDLESDLTEIRQKLGLPPNPHVGVPVVPTTATCGY